MNAGPGSDRVSGGNPVRATDRREIEWPPPKPDPDREPSHPGAFHDHRDDGWWERWLRDGRTDT